MAPETLLTIAIVILLLPLLGFTINIFFGKRLEKIGIQPGSHKTNSKYSSIISTLIIGTDLILAISVVAAKVWGHFAETTYQTWGGSLKIFVSDSLVQAKFHWFSLGNTHVNIGIGIDNLSATMLIVVTLISFLVHLFSTEYMGDDKRFSRYYAYLGLFTFSMLGIVLANNFMCMYIFWELVGISSYLLIGFWYEKKSASDAGKKAFITNRIGDFGFLIGILMLFYAFGTFMFDEVFANIANPDTITKIASGAISLPFGLDYGTFLTLAGIFVFCGAIGKSAQFPLHVWLPDAMEGPTPVSALIHAATMVAAGVYLVARVFPMLSSGALTFIAYIGAVTALMAATIAITQTDFKKVLAYSTVSQLGYMIMSLGACSYMTGYFHLVTHAWFKAALFLASGSVIHAMHHAMHHLGDHHSDPQDIRNMGGLRKTMPWTFATFLFVTLAISGVPLTSGFLSKDGILAGTLAFAQLTGNWFIPFAGFTAAGITAFYMFRLLILAFNGEHKTEIASHTKENKFVIVFPLVLLSVLSLWFFYSPNPTDAHAGWFAHAIKAPVTAVPADYQFNFLMPNDGKNPYPPKELATVHHSAEVPVAEHHSAEKAYANKFEEQMHHTHLPAMILSLLIAGCGIAFSFMVYQFKIFDADKMEKQFKLLHTISYRKWYFDEIYDATAIAFTTGLSKILGLFDNKVVDGIVNLTALVTRGFSYFIGHFDNIVIDGLVNLSANIMGLFGAILRKFQTGRVQTYLVMAVIALMILIYWLV